MIPVKMDGDMDPVANVEDNTERRNSVHAILLSRLTTEKDLTSTTQKAADLL